jgi:hypothetical protein
MKRPEQEIQKAVLAHLKVRGVPSILYFHVPSGGYRRPIEAAIFTSLGAIPGIPDLIIIKGGHCFALELKAAGGPAIRQSERGARQAQGLRRDLRGCLRARCRTGAA